MATERDREASFGADEEGVREVVELAAVCWKIG